MVVMNTYSVTPEIPDDASISLAAYPELTRRLLFNRGITGQKEADVFLNPDYERDLSDPFLMLNMEKAVDRVLRAVKEDEKIVIYGDYDCDGIPGSVVLHDFFKKIGYKNFENYIPHRHSEGYGLNMLAVEKFARQGVKLLITVDCGITDCKEVARGNELGIDTIITDHHLVQENVPPAHAIIDPKQKEDSSPDPMLCGAGVAFKFVQALIARGDFEIAEGWEKWLLDMAGLSTIADMVPLQKENRVIAFYGLKVLRKSPRPGMQKLLRSIKMNQAHISEDDVGFMIAPRINAASRMSDPREAFRLLATDDAAVAGELASHLEKINNERKWTVAQMIKEIKKILKEREPKDVIVVGNPNWRVGILGIAANNIVEEYAKPVFVWGREGAEYIKGSCRSDGTVNVVDLMTSVSSDLFIDVGGHELSGGFSISHEKIHLLENEIVAAYHKKKRESVEKITLIDGKLDIDEVNWTIYREIEKFAPFGIGNAKPTFLFEGILVQKVNYFGKGKNHLRIDFHNSLGKIVSGISFFADKTKFRRVSFAEGDKVDIVAVFDKSMFRNFPELRLRIIDIL
ncbi:MAG: single-stranded-DNA-specific exonuclease RecJ [Candidatus Yonathbacteria bacterium CG_4_10_14_3_um_filter_47_65]|uniref:Single-stranded-DNA-specific exonuclease RecJ n=2 Tax=Parcubacteria group TaxID=1794811 RepID=A0A2M8DA11_9BACT|nr:MAG: single-stranded-DNA-specific exonuclease RecJ [Candidatus Nomurabacteria bacterium CG1_02_47_685]PIP04229.1 MAG: single-stranded-DNA-specific exonuclease RecJ [Candidatus Yonathbacteria bacterium CG23_combo_of_CG06-09_8_20_14_all_46_18]PIQ31621.1 MAG: single-stranded-DNA-specific exonuclease RecJ [Candidatus Yonathbacteria bacterium CG17_big_fil_post_rev_8_21_14_2_50_46_19]PIX56120.1 MAG: single-stranded-DNA-specific exonuclease RecJ [Candidatus Yonathbacteria bacterium CG_4_10_14_3_um_f